MRSAVARTVMRCTTNSYEELRGAAESFRRTFGIHSNHRFNTEHEALEALFQDETTEGEMLVATMQASNLLASCRTKIFVGSSRKIGESATFVRCAVVVAGASPTEHPWLELFPFILNVHISPFSRLGDFWKSCLADQNFPPTFSQVPNREEPLGLNQTLFDTSRPRIHTQTHYNFMPSLR